MLKRLIIGFLAAVLGVLLGPAGSAVALNPDESAPAYTYAPLAHGATAPGTTTERGPPAAYNPATAYNAVARWSHGASARQDGPTPSRAFAYDNPALLVQAARTSGTPRTGEAGDVGDLSSLRASWCCRKQRTDGHVQSELGAGDRAEFRQRCRERRSDEAYAAW